MRGDLPVTNLCRLLLAACVTTGVTARHARAVTQLSSADGQFWDIQDSSAWAQDSGGIATGGRCNPFNGFGYLKLQLRHADDSLIGCPRYLHGFGLAY